MRLFASVLICVTATSAATHIVIQSDPRPKCDGLEISGKFHKIEVLAKGLNRPYQLSYHKKKHEIYFSNNVGNDTEDQFEIKVLLENGTDIALENIENGFATAIDEDHQVAYFGGSNGVYEMNLENGTINKIIDNHNIWDMFIKKHLYFITYPNQKLFKYKEVGHTSKSKNQHKEKTKMKIEEVKEKIIHGKMYQFAIDGDDDVFMTNETGLFMIKNGTEQPFHIQGETVFRAIEINHKGEAYFCGRNHIYVVKKHEHLLHKIASVRNIFGLTFDFNGNLVFSNPHQIVRALPSECKKP